MTGPSAAGPAKAMDGKSIPAQSSLRYLWAYSAGDDWTLAWHRRLLERRRQRGFDVEGFCVTPASIGGRWFPFPELNNAWRTGNPGLMQMYSDLTEKLLDRDVLILYNGANLHPEFVSWLKVLKVYTAGDDPESTEILTKPLAPAFDIHLINNAACVDMYRSWGLKRVHFWPLGSLTTEEVSDLTEEQILDVQRRPLGIAFIGDRNDIRKERLDRMANAFPDAFCAGRGWPRGMVGWDEMWSTYRKARTGWNLHNSTGPINFRLYDLTAYGVMQICDNRSHLGQVYEEGTEAVGFDTIDQCIELTRYYLAHPDAQREIAVGGWKRWKRDYTPDRVWDKLVAAVESHRVEFAPPVVEEVSAVKAKLQKHSRRTVVRRQAQRIYNSLRHQGGRLRRKMGV